MPDPSIHLGDEDVHLWWIALDPPLEALVEQFALLSSDEQARASRFYFERDRRRYIAGRAFLRTQLGAYLGMDPASITFNYSSQGKPSLLKTVESRSLLFNLSNSAERALVVFRWEHPVGVDLEWIHPMPDEDDFARQFFCPAEIALLCSLQGEAKRKKFFELWTCKEAFLKAMGDGLTRPINEVEVALEGHQARLVAIADNASLAADWQIVLFEPAAGYQAGLACTVSQEQRPADLKFYDVAGDLYLDMQAR